MFIIFKINREVHPHHRHINFLLIITILLIIVIIILVKPALIGYKISKQFEEIGMSTAEFLKSLDLIESELLVAETKLESCKSLNKDILADVSTEKNASFRCMQDKNAMKSQYESIIREYTFNLSRIQPEFESQKKELEAELNRQKITTEEFQSRYDSLLKNSANNICCKAKVDNKEVDSYIVSNHKIVCTTGEEKEISC